MISKKTQSNIIVTVLLVLIGIGAIAGVGVFINKSVKSSIKDAEIKTQFEEVSLQIKDVKFASGSALVKISRTQGKIGDAPVMAKIVITGKNGEILDFLTPTAIPLLETKEYNIPGLTFVPEKVEIYPVLNSSGSNVFGNKMDVFEVKSFDAKTLLDYGLVGYFKLDGNAVDFTSNPVTSTCRNTTMVINCNYVSGKVGQGIYLDGINKSVYVQLTNDAKFMILNKTINFWANHKSSDSLYILFGCSSNYYIGTSWNRMAQSYTNLTGQQKYSSSDYLPALNDNKFDMFTYTYDVNGNYVNVSFYYNGYYISNYFLNQSHNTPGSGFRIGCLPPSCNYAFNGTIDELKIWNRALSSEEIAKIYASY